MLCDVPPHFERQDVFDCKDQGNCRVGDLQGKPEEVQFKTTAEVEYGS